MKFIFRGFISKIVGMIIIAQAATLFIIGAYNINHFGRQIENRFISQMKIPGNLLSNNALRYNAINDSTIMEQFLGKDIEEAILIGTDNMVYYSLNPAYRGRSIHQLNNLEYIESTGKQLSETKIAKSSYGKSSYLICITPIKSESGKFLGHLYIKAGTEQLEKEKRIVLFIFLFGSLTAIVLVIVIGVLHSHKFQNKIHFLVSFLKNISEGEGDLTKRISIDSNDELGEIAHYYNKFTNKLESIISNLQIMVVNLSSAFSQLSLNSQLISTNTQEQSAQIQSIAAKIYQVTENFNTLADASDKMVNQAEESMEYSRQGKIINDELKNQMREVLKKEEEFSNELQDLKINSEKITKIIQVITEITDQTNLVALNASIQASRAGKERKGFSVVAGEIRDLAQKTQKSTQEISIIIKNIQNKVNSVVTAMNSNLVMIENVSEQAETAAEMNDRINNTSNMTLSIVEKTKSSYKEHNTAMDTIHHNITTIDEASTETSNSVADMTKTIAEMTKEVESLKSIVDKFIVRNLN